MINKGNRENNVIDVEVNENGQAVTVAEADPEGTGTINLGKVDELRNDSTMLAIRDTVKNKLIESGKMEQLTAQINIDDTNTIIEFGKEPAMYMATISDQIIGKYDISAVNNVGKLVDSLMKLFKQIDMEEIKTLDQLKEERAKKGLFSKLKETAQQKLERLTKKYNGIAAEIEKLCEQLRVYEANIKKTNTDIGKMYDASVQQYTELQEFIAAGDQALLEIKDYHTQLEQEASESGDSQKMLDARAVDNVATLMEKRLADLRAAEAIALQGIPTYKIQEYTNSNLARKINSAFIVTIPAFKNSITSLILAKQQMLTAQGLSVLDDAAAEFYKQSAHNMVGAMLASQEVSNRSAITAADIEENWNTIMDGIKQYKSNEETYRKIREEEIRKIDASNEKFSKALKNGTVL